MCIDLLQIKLILVLINLQRLHNFSRHLLAVDGRELVEFLAHMVSVLPVFLIILSRLEFRELYHFRLIRHHVVLFALEKVGWHLHKNGYMDRSFHLMTRKGEDRFCEHFVNFLALASLVLSFLLLHDDFFHLLDRHCAFNVNPFVENRMAVSELQNKVDATNIIECYEPKSSRFLGPFVL